MTNPVIWKKRIAEIREMIENEIILWKKAYPQQSELIERFGNKISLEIAFLMEEDL